MLGRLTLSNRSPPDIQVDTNWAGVMVTPSRGTTFGCLKCFHTTASLQKIYGLCQPRRTGREPRKQTFLGLSAPSIGYIRMRFTQTSERSRVPLYTSPQPPAANGSGPTVREDEIMYDRGSVILNAHMLLSSRKHFRAVALKGGRLSRAYARLSGEGGREARQHTSSR